MELNEENRDFLVWLNYFEKNNSITKFIYLLNKKDTYFLNNPLSVDFENDLYEKIFPAGFLEKDFQNLLIQNDKKSSEDKNNTNSSQIRLAFAFYKGLDFSLIINRIGNTNFFNVLESVLIEGFYEEYDLPFEKLISIAINKYKLTKNSLVDISFMRGINLGNRYKNQSEKILKQKIFKNKLKIKMGM